MNIYENSLYKQDIIDVACLDLPWEKLQNTSILVTGATGMLASFLIDVIMWKNMKSGLNCTVNAVSRNEETARKRFESYWTNTHFIYESHDVSDSLERSFSDSFSYVVHMASNTHPVQYATDPVGTITTNIIGLKNILDYSAAHNVKRVVFSSSNEIYGENRGDTELFKEDYCGYINSNTLRAGYPESKRCGEALCQAYISQYGVDAVIARFTRSYGPTLLRSDTKALSQFLHNGLNHEDIVLKSEGTQYYSYTYVADAISGLLTVMLCGVKGEAYNIADEKSDIRLKDLAEIVAGWAGRKVIFKLPDEVEKTGYSKATKARLDSSKLQKLGWKAKYDIKTGIERTLEIMKEEYR